MAAANQFVVTWQKQQFTVAFDFQQTPLAMLKDYLAHLTGVPAAAMKLLHSGGTFED